MSKFIKKLGSDNTYVRPKTTFQEKLTNDEISEKLQGYEKVDDLFDVPLNTHIRYFIQQKDGSQLFRTGGFLHNKTNAGEYITLSNGKNSWSVQTKNTIFFKKMSQKEEIESLHKHYKKKLQEKDAMIKKLKKIINKKFKDIDPKQDARENIDEEENIENLSDNLIKKSSSKTSKRSSSKLSKRSSSKLSKRSSSKLSKKLPDKSQNKSFKKSSSKSSGKTRNN